VRFWAVSKQGTDAALAHAASPQASRIGHCAGLLLGLAASVPGAPSRSSVEGADVLVGSLLVFVMWSRSFAVDPLAGRPFDFDNPGGCAVFQVPPGDERDWGAPGGGGGAPHFFGPCPDDFMRARLVASNGLGAEAWGKASAKDRSNVSLFQSDNSHSDPPDAGQRSRPEPC